MWMYTQDNTVTQAMSAGPTACDVISLSCYVSVFSLFTSLQLSEAQGSENRPKPAQAKFAF